MRCNWPLEQRGVKGQWPLDRRPSTTRPCCTAALLHRSLWNFNTTHEEFLIEPQRELPLPFLWHSSSQSAVAPPTPTPPSQNHTFHQWGKKRREENVEIITATGTAGSLLGSFAQLAFTGHWTQTSCRCSWRVVVFISLANLKKKEKKRKKERKPEGRHCIHSAARCHVCLRVCNVSSRWMGAALALASYFYHVANLQTALSTQWNQGESASLTQSYWENWERSCAPQHTYTALRLMCCVVWRTDPNSKWEVLFWNHGLAACGSPLSSPHFLFSAPYQIALLLLGVGRLS